MQYSENVFFDPEHRNAYFWCSIPRLYLFCGVLEKNKKRLIFEKVKSDVIVFSENKIMKFLSRKMLIHFEKIIKQKKKYKQEQL